MEIDIAAKVKEFREKLGLSQAELGKIFNRKKASVSAWECGESKPPVDFFLRLEQMVKEKASDKTGG